MCLMQLMCMLFDRCCYKASVAQLTRLPSHHLEANGWSLIQYSNLAFFIAVCLALYMYPACFADFLIGM